jgi:DNA helicase-2/ATP-dependent DNA helicase PcrA
LRSEARTKEISTLVKKYGLKKEGLLGYGETLVYLLIYSELVGFKKYEKFDYCVVDEGQDFSVLEYSVLDKLVKNGRFGILGDLNQSFSGDGLSSWEEIYEVVEGSKHAQKFILETNYRSTKPIIDFANKILSPYTDSYLPKSINRKGPVPEVVAFDKINDVMTELGNEIKNDMKNLDKSVGIICMNEKYLGKTQELLSSLNIPQEKLITLREKDRIAYLPRAVYLTHFNDCKGLEFGKVYIVGLGLSKITSFGDAKKAFVAVTRAMDELKVYADKETEK